MTTDNSHNAEVSSPRFEFRLFGNDFTLVAERMAQLSGPVPERVQERRSDEIYIMSKHNDVNNIKIRYGLMDIKVLLRTVGGLEQWEPLMKAEFPIDSGILVDHVFPALQVRISEPGERDYSLDDFLTLIATNADLQAVDVRKHRHGYSVNETICEMAEIDIDGVKVVTVAIESTDIDAVRKTINDLGLTGMENINYLQGIKRVIGMIDKPLAN
jgi:hypothetical protein